MLVATGHTYAAFASRPFFVSTSTLEGAGQSRGFDSVLVLDRDDDRVKSLPVALLAVPGQQGHADDWNTIALGHWGGPTQDLTLPSQVRAVADITPPDGTASDGTAAAPQGVPAGLLTAEQCGKPWRTFTAVAAAATMVIGGAVGFILGKRRARRTRR